MFLGDCLDAVNACETSDVPLFHDRFPLRLCHIVLDCPKGSSATVNNLRYESI